MIAIGFVMVVMGWWVLPDYLPECPVRIDQLLGGIGCIALFAGVLVMLLSVFTGRQFGGRRYWY